MGDRSSSILYWSALLFTSLFRTRSFHCVPFPSTRRVMSVANKHQRECNEMNERWETTKDRRVIPAPIDDREFQQLQEFGKDGVLLGITINPKICMGGMVRRIPICSHCR